MCVRHSAWDAGTSRTSSSTSSSTSRDLGWCTSTSTAGGWWRPPDCAQGDAMRRSGDVRSARRFRSRYRASANDKPTPLFQSRHCHESPQSVHCPPPSLHEGYRSRLHTPPLIGASVLSSPAFLLLCIYSTRRSVVSRVKEVLHLHHARADTKLHRVPRTGCRVPRSALVAITRTPMSELDRE